MCVAIIGFRAHSAAPLVVAANRDEFHGRASTPPSVRSERPWVVAGQDLEKGGTWLGMNAWGIVGLTNDPSGKWPSRDERSRGLLVFDALRAPSLPHALAVVRAHPHRYAPFHLLALGLDGGVVVNWDGTRITEDLIVEGWHVLPNGALDAQDDFKVTHVRAALSGAIAGATTPAALARALKQVLSSHARPSVPPPRPSRYPGELRRALASLCVHAPGYGTRSSSVLMMGGRAGRRYWHLEGPPCQASLTPVDLA